MLRLCVQGSSMMLRCSCVVYALYIAVIGVASYLVKRAGPQFEEVVKDSDAMEWMRDDSKMGELGNFLKKRVDAAEHGVKAVSLGFPSDKDIGEDYVSFENLLKSFQEGSVPPLLVNLFKDFHVDLMKKFKATRTPLGRVILRMPNGKCLVDWFAVTFGEVNACVGKASNWKDVIDVFVGRLNKVVPPTP